MNELIIAHAVKNIVLEPKEEEYSFPRRISYRDIEVTEESLEVLNKFGKLTKKESLKILDVEKELEPVEMEFIKFVIESRIKKKLKYKLLVNLYNNYHYIVLPECTSNFIYQNMIFFKSDLKNLEADMIKYINIRRKEKIFKYLELKDNISIYKKIDKNIEDLNNFIKLYNPSPKEIYRITFDSCDTYDHPINEFKILIGLNDNYVSIKGSPTDLEFLLFVKDYYPRF